MSTGRVGCAPHRGRPVTPWSRRRLRSSSHGVRSARTPPTPASHRIEKQGAPGSGDYEIARSSVNAAVHSGLLLIVQVSRACRGYGHHRSRRDPTGFSSELKSAGGRWFERSNGRICGLRATVALACERRLDNSIVGGCERTSRSGRRATATEKAALHVLRSPPRWPRGCRAGQAAYVFPNRRMFCGRPKARKVGGPVALSSRRLTGGCANVASGLASRT